MTCACADCSGNQGLGHACEELANPLFPTAAQFCLLNAILSDSCHAHPCLMNRWPVGPSAHNSPVQCEPSVEVPSRLHVFWGCFALPV